MMFRSSVHAVTEALDNTPLCLLRYLFARPKFSTVELYTAAYPQHVEF